jgi:Tryptophan-associated transmembrane protein (Trp_oprn_chp)
MNASGTPDRRLLTYTVVLCVAGAGLALFAATRTWAVEVTPRPAPLPALRDARTGGDVVAWLPGLALVGLAGAGAVLATRGLARTAVGGALVLCGAGVLAGAVPHAGDGLWPVLCALGGAALAAGGGLTAVRGRGWPALGARYERRAPDVAGSRVLRERAGEEERRALRDRAPGSGGTVAAWDALDRGEDPTDG